MYLSACLDKGFSGRGFISPPALGWVESAQTKEQATQVKGFISPPALGWVERELLGSCRTSSCVSSALPPWGGLKEDKQILGGFASSWFHQPSRLGVG